jgi:hypothetical protein
MYENADLCRKCGGRCCKLLPGTAHPQDFGLPGENGEQKVKEALGGGRWAIDWWVGDPRDDAGAYGLRDCYFVRPATKGKDGKLLDPSRGGTCTFLGKNGCTIEADARPTNCKLLEPGEKECIYHGKVENPKQDGALEWIPYQGLLRAITEEDPSAADDHDE